MKKVLVIGANGGIGRIITTKMSDSADFSPVAAFRKENQKAFFEERNINYQIVDLEADIASIEKAMENVDAVVFTAGSGGTTGFGKTLTVDLDGAVKTMEAAQNAGVQRFVMISAMHADNRQAWQQTKIKPYMVAKHYADRFLKSSGLDYTILQPGRLFDKEGTGKITTTNPSEKEGIPREDVAQTVIEVLQHDNTIGKTIAFNEGNQPVGEILEKI